MRTSSKGEFVLLVAGAADSESTAIVDADVLLRILLRELPLKQAAGAGGADHRAEEKCALSACPGTDGSTESLARVTRFT